MTKLEIEKVIANWKKSIFNANIKPIPKNYETALDSNFIKLTIEEQVNSLVEDYSEYGNQIIIKVMAFFQWIQTQYHCSSYYSNLINNIHPSKVPDEIIVESWPKKLKDKALKQELYLKLWLFKNISFKNSVEKWKVI